MSRPAFKVRDGPRPFDGPSAAARRIAPAPGDGRVAPADRRPSRGARRDARTGGDHPGGRARQADEVGEGQGPPRGLRPADDPLRRRGRPGGRGARRSSSSSATGPIRSAPPWPTSPTSVFATQERQLGTGDAVRACRPLLDDYAGPALVLVGDEPLIRPEPLADLLARREAEEAACLLGTAIVPDPTGLRPDLARLRRPVPPDRRGARLQPRGGGRSARSTRAATSSSCPASGTPWTGSTPATPRGNTT